MPDPCTNCPICSGCDWLSSMCRLQPEQLPKLRPDLIGTLSPWELYYRRNRDKFREWNKEAARRYRSDRQRRLQVERRYRERHKDEINARRREQRLTK